MTERIGLEAVLEMSGFNNGMKQYTSGIDQMEGKTERASGTFGKMGKAIGGAVVAGVGLAVAGLGVLAGAIASTIGPAAEAQQVEAQLDAVLRSTGAAAAEQAAQFEAAQGKTVTSTRMSASALEELRQKLTGMKLDYTTLGASIQEQKQRVWELTQQYGEQGLNVQTAKAKLAEMQNQYKNMGGDIDALTNKIAKGGETITVSLVDKLGLVPPVVQMTKDELLKLADGLSQVTPFEDEMIIATESVLLQFKNLGKDVFPQATEMALDLAQRLGIDAVSAAKMLGKALVEPGEGLARLKQAGVSFSDEQEKMIKKMFESGDVAGAQKLIMDELAKSVGGAAKAAGQTFAGKMEIMKNKIGNVKEAIGTAFLPILTELVDKFSEFVTKNGPAIQKFFEELANWITTKLVPAIMEIYNWLATNLPIAIQTVTNFWTGTLQPALQAIWDFIQTSLLPIFQTVADWFAGTGTSSIGGFAEKITTLLGPAIAFAQEMFATIITWVQTNWPLIQQTITTVMNAIQAVISTVLAAIQQFWQDHGQQIISVLTNVWTIIKTIIETAINAVLGIIRAVMQMINGDWSGAWETIKEVLVNVWEAIKSIVELAFENVKTMLSIGLDLLKSIWEQAWTALKTKAGQIWDSIVNAVEGWMSSLADKFRSFIQKMVDVGEAIVRGLWQGIKDWWGNLEDNIIGLITSLIDWIRRLLGIGSPSKVTMGIGTAMAEGLILGWTKTLQDLSLPAMSFASPAMATAGGGGGGGSTVNVNFGNTTISSGMDQAAFEARVELAVARAVRGI